VKPAARGAGGLIATACMGELRFGCASTQRGGREIMVVGSHDH